MNINDIEYINCTGCSACYSKCPHKAIDMNYDREGFIYPYVDESKCTDCNVCIKVCPALNVKHIKPELQDIYPFGLLSPEDVVNVLLYLLSDKANNFTGKFLDINNGYFVK